jgi:hypothetical protein
MYPVIEQIIIGAAILGAAAYFVVPRFLPRKKGCAAGCGCSVAKKPFQVTEK